eukprot:GFYU01002724.1.p1 GENE.GFYU01002724.1~~GFYU01002724.1.p1  ORF type:complete len:595 (-),score=154.58 GFYU01002724.1:156-1940(-)
MSNAEDTKAEAAAAAGDQSEDGKRGQGPWLHAWLDPVASFQSFSSCIRCADLDCNNEDKLLLADPEQRKLRVYKGTTVVTEHTLLEKPCSICVFYQDEKTPRTPSVAVAAGPYIFIYRHMKPYFKFTLPSLEIDTKENEIWGDLKDGNVDPHTACEMLAAARDNGSQLTSRSFDLLAIEDPQSRADFAIAHKDTPLVQHTSITCMEVINKNMDEPRAVTQLVMGTESKHVMILNPGGSSILTKVKLNGVPVFMAINGLFEVEYRIVVACRDGNVYTIKNGELTGNAVELESLPVGLVLLDKSFYVGVMGNMIHNYHIKGRKNYTIYLPASVSCMELMSLQATRNLKCMVVALSNGEVRVYNEKAMIHSLQTNDVVVGMRFDSFAREQFSLIMSMKSRSLCIKILQRNANLESPSNPAGPPPEQDVPLNVPKKTKLYVEQTERERDQATEMHRIFQRDLCKLRLTTARAYVKVITDGQGPISYTSRSSLRVNANVSGFGPLFKIKLSIQNTGAKHVVNVPVVLSYNQLLYKTKTPTITIPLLVPGLEYSYEVSLECIDQNGGSDIVRIYLCDPESCVPVISAIVTMPLCEALEEY